ncbi:MAG TPA: sugar phosphate nucleotidyltransferase [Candidatus Kapabacteria bacterium]|nr:sugar phosphate nucleotidyltransferase [Candidatus Kapabacteria bacterium]
MTTRLPLAAVIMAAGQGKRMQDPTKPKVLYPLADQPLVSYVVRLCKELGCDRTIAIVGYGREQVQAYLRSEFPDVETAIQDQQLGTGHAVRQAESTLEGFDGDILVLSGDVPLLKLGTAQGLIAEHRATNALATVLTVDLEDPHGYGRIVRTGGSSLERIVEEKDATDEIRQIREINSGIYVFNAKALWDSLQGLTNKNAQGEYYLTDVFASIIAKHGSDRVTVFKGSDPVEVSGVNTKDQLQSLENEYLKRSA